MVTVEGITPLLERVLDEALGETASRDDVNTVQAQLASIATQLEGLSTAAPAPRKGYDKATVELALNRQNRMQSIRRFGLEWCSHSEVRKHAPQELHLSQDKEFAELLSQMVLEGNTSGATAAATTSSGWPTSGQRKRDRQHASSSATEPMEVDNRRQRTYLQLNTGPVSKGVRQPDGKIKISLAGTVMGNDVPSSVGPIIARLKEQRDIVSHDSISQRKLDLAIRLPDPLGDRASIQLQRSMLAAVVHLHWLSGRR